MRFVVIESPYAGADETERAENLEYARACLLDCLKRGEAPFASHLLYTQVLNDDVTQDREMGIEAGLTVGSRAAITVVYADRGISPGMQRGIDRATAELRPVIYRRLKKHDAGCDVWAFKECDCGAI